VTFDHDYVAVGHVTCDRIEDALGGPRSQPGGGAFYSALQAARLGLRALIVTKGDPQQIEQLLAPYRGELDVQVLPSEHTTTLATRGSGPTRVQRVRAWAGPIEESLELSGSIVHLAPVARETPSKVVADGSFIGVTPQGLVRSWDAKGRISPTQLDRSLLPAHFHAAVISEEESVSCAALLERRPPSLVAITAGSGPIRLHLPGGTVSRVPAIGVSAPRDDLGAGDVFAAALFIALRRGSSPGQAARYASATAAVRVAGVGPAAVGDAADIERLLSDSA
jgi:sugar/nucleoside kinase (ribokinase family)